MKVGIKMGLSERKRQILNTLIDAYIECCEPIGSKSSVFDKFNLSSATLRNEMAYLEEIGFLYQPHTSAGRVPSNLGYRYYVDNIINALEIDSRRINDIEMLLQGRNFRADKLLADSAQLAASLTNCAAVSISDTSTGRTFIYFECTPINERHVAIMAVVGSDTIKTCVFTSSVPITVNDCAVLNRILNVHLTGIVISNLSDNLFTDIEIELNRYVPSMVGITRVIKNIIQDLKEVEVIVYGESNLLTYPEFYDVEKLRNFYSVISDRNNLPNIISKPQDGIAVIIDPDYLPDSALITTSIPSSDNGNSTLSVIGPKRMNYSRVISDMRYLTDTLIKMYENSENNGEKGTK